MCLESKITCRTRTSRTSSASMHREPVTGTVTSWSNPAEDLQLLSGLRRIARFHVAPDSLGRMHGCVPSTPMGFVAPSWPAPVLSHEIRERTELGRLLPRNAGAKWAGSCRLLHRRTQPRGPTARYEDSEEYVSEKRRALVAAILSPIFTIGTLYAFLPNILGPSVRKQGWYKERFARGMEGMADYERGVSGIKKDLFSLVGSGVSLVDLGAGLGPNIPYLPKDVVYTAVEPNTYMHPAITSKADAYLKGGSSKPSIVETITDIPTASQDVVVSTLVLCSVDNQRAILEEINRVLKPGGLFLFLEHVAARDQGYPDPYNQGSYDWSRAFYRWAQQAMTPLQVALADGCHPARDTLKEISQEFSDVFHKSFDVPDLWGVRDWASFFPIGPQIAGAAIKSPKRYAGQFAEVQFKFCAAGGQPLMADPTGDTDKQRAWQESGGEQEALRARGDSLKCQ